MKFLELAEQVMVQREQDGVRGRDRELSRMRCYIVTADFATKDVTEIGARDIREWLRTMAQKDAARPGAPRKLSRQTISRSQSLVSAILNEAVERELIEGNPCLGVRAKKRVDSADTVDKWAYLTADEQSAIATCETIPRADRLMIAFSAHTGLRQGEWRHLRLEDLIVDGDHPRVIVRVAGRDKSGNPLPPKSGKKREVPLLPTALAVAREWLAQLPTYAPENPHGLVFPTASGKYRQQGKPLGRSGTTRAHYDAAGIKLRPHLHWHALRHTFASNLVTGVYGRRWTLQEVRDVLGHSSVNITERYAHLGEDAIRRAVMETIASQPVETSQAITVVPTELVTSARENLFGRLVSRFAAAKKFVEEALPHE